MRVNVWLGSAAALVALLVAIAAVIGLRGTAPPPAEATAVPAPNAVSAAVASAPALPAPSFDVVTVDPQARAVIAGRAAPGDHVTVLDGSSPLGEVTADAHGEWVLLPTQPIVPGNRQLSLEATAPNESSPRHSADVVALSVAPSAAARSGANSLAVLLPGDPTHPVRILQQPPSSGDAGRMLSLDSAEFSGGDRLALSGHAAPGSRLNVFAGQALLGIVTADSAGKWSLTTGFSPPSGSVELRLQELSATGGGPAQQIAVPLAPSAAGSTYVVVRGNSLWTIARHFYGNGRQYTAIYQANRQQIPDPDRIYPGQQFKMPKS